MTGEEERVFGVPITNEIETPYQKEQASAKRGHIDKIKRKVGK